MSIETIAARMGFPADQALALEQACHKYGINTPLRVAHFLAQVAHESGTGKWLREIWGPTAAQRGYEGRKDLGNTQPGDGRRFMGRGLIQLTGRANYAEYSQDTYGSDIAERVPEMVGALPDAALAAGWFWWQNGLNALADRDDVVLVTRRVNGGTNGLADRVKHLDKAKRLFAEMVKHAKPDFSNVTSSVTRTEDSP